jgi:thymidylate synthase
MTEEKREDAHEDHFGGGDFILRSQLVDMRNRGLIETTHSDEAHIPSVHIYAKNIPEAYHRAILAVWERGVQVHTHYDKRGGSGDFIDLPSKEATVIINVQNPFNEPRISKIFPGGPVDLEKYFQEVVRGIHNHWITPGTPMWTYTYSERMTDYAPSENLNDTVARGILLSRKKLNEFLKSARSVEEIREALQTGRLDVEHIDQIEKIIQDLKRDITSKGAQATTWMPTADPGLESNRPCLQRLWFRPLEAEINGQKGYILNLNTHWRSRDLYEAWFMNVIAITEWQQVIAERLEKELGVPVRVGGYIDISDSLHLYGKYLRKETSEGQKFYCAMEAIKTKSLEDLTYTSDDERIADSRKEERERLAADPDYYNPSMASRRKKQPLKITPP